jgi:serine/threonine-protein kinase
MTSSLDRWATVERLYHAALARPAGERAAFLAEACASDDPLRREVESLLAQPASAEDLLARGAVAAAAGLVSDAGNSTLTGQRIGAYQVLAPIGAGGMGEVYRARDTRLGRDVAIKILPREFTSNPDRLARFEREARVLASLNHPHVGAIYGIEDQSADAAAGFSRPVHALVLELVEGETLAERIARHKGAGLPLTEALDIARQIADALDAAHERGIVHRDLKPTNIKITPEGVVKVLDFGLAKLEVLGSDEGGTASPTITVGDTREGVVIGTAAYMSPEQARGQAVDKRTDIWAFGCVLYEMLTGRAPFPGATVSDTIAAILERQPDWTSLPASVPPAVRRLLERCLDKDRRRRMRDIGDVRVEIEDTSTAASMARRTTFVQVAAIAVLAVIVAIGTVWYLKPIPSEAPQAEARFVLPMPDGVGLPLAGQSRLAVSPDGRHVAFIGTKGGKQQLYVRALEDAEAKALPDTNDADQPFFSPDSRWLGFFADGKLKKVPADGGVPIVITDATSSRGGFWGENGKIVFAPQARGSGIVQVSADGGPVKPITMLDASRGETSHRLPELLPGGHAVLFVAYGATYQDVSIVAQSLETGERRVVIEGASLPHYVSSGHLLYATPQRAGTIMAVSFDVERLVVTGTAVPVVEGVLTDRGDYAHWSLARSGMLVYAPGGFKAAENDLVLVDRNGVATLVGAPPQRPYRFPRLSPDGQRIVVALEGIQTTLWIYERSIGAFNRLTFGGNNSWPIWTPDGKRVTYASNRAEPWHLYSKAFDGSGMEEKLLPISKNDQEPYAWSPDGNVLFYQEATAATRQDVWAMSIHGDSPPRAVLQTSASELDARPSVDGRWLAYASDESGRYEVYVQSLAGGGKWQVSTDGGREPVWAHSGKEIFYRSGNKMMAATVATQPTFSVAPPHVLFAGSYEATNTTSPDYDVTADDQRFLMAQPSRQLSSTTGLNVVLNWAEELKRVTPASGGLK